MTAALAGTDAPARFGFRLSGVPLLVPASLTALFLPAAGVDPMPLAPPRLRGFTQRHGRSIPVFDGDAAPPSRLPVRTRQPLLVFEGGAEPTALLVDAPPERIAGPLSAAASLSQPQSPLRSRPQVGWQDALGEPCTDAHGDTWWEIELPRLFDLLARA